MLNKINNSKLFYRADFDVSISKEGIILDDYRIQKNIQSCLSLLNKSNKLVLFTKLGRPDSYLALDLDRLTTRRLLNKLEKITEKKIFFIKNLEDLLTYTFEHEIALFENTRFFDWEKNLDINVAKNIVKKFDIFINESFAMNHRKETTNFLIPSLMKKKYLGTTFINEISNLNIIKQGDLNKPSVFIIGGAKPETKIPLLLKLKDKFDYILVGGLLCKTDFWINKEMPSNILLAEHQTDGLDINKKSIELFTRIINRANSIVFNGAMGVFEKENAYLGTKSIIESIEKNEKAEKYIGGGDTIKSIKKFGSLSTYDYISTGGGAFLTYLSE